MRTLRVLTETELNLAELKYGKEGSFSARMRKQNKKPDKNLELFLRNYLNKITGIRIWIRIMKDNYV